MIKVNLYRDDHNKSQLTGTKNRKNSAIRKNWTPKNCMEDYLCIDVVKMIP